MFQDLHRHKTENTAKDPPKVIAPPSRSHSFHSGNSVFLDFHFISRAILKSSHTVCDISMFVRADSLAVEGENVLLVSSDQHCRTVETAGQCVQPGHVQRTGAVSLRHRKAPGTNNTEHQYTVTYKFVTISWFLFDCTRSELTGEVIRWKVSW